MTKQEKTPQDILAEAGKLIQAGYNAALDGKTEISETHLSRGLRKIGEWLAVSDPDHVEMIGDMPVLKSSLVDERPNLRINSFNGRTEIVRPERYQDKPPQVEKYASVNNQEVRYLAYQSQGRRFIIDEAGTLQVMWQGKLQRVTKELYREFRQAVESCQDVEALEFWQKYAEI